MHVPSATSHKLEPKVAELLLLLLRHAGELVSQEQLQQALWPDTIVEQNSLYQLLTKLRRLLQDPSRQPHYIKTVPKKGYCWIATVSAIPNATSAVTSTVTAAPAPVNQARWQRVLAWPQLLWAAVGVIAIAGLSAVASRQDDSPTPAPSYQVSDVSYALGQEVDVDAHPTQDLLAYVKDVYQLEITDKHGQVVQRLPFHNRVAKPAWHPTRPLVAFWHFREDSCELHIVSSHGAINHVAAPKACLDVEKPVWHTDEELVVVLKEAQQRHAYLYRLSTREWVPIPLPLRADQRLITAVKGWQDTVYYVLQDSQHRSQLIDLKGDVVLRWPYPVWLIAFDQPQGAMVTNDDAKHTALLAMRADGQRYTLFNTAQGVFTSISVDHSGTVYTGLEAWEVDIRDKDNVPIFSTTSIDYLPVSNALGETAFMSRRSGVCEVYLHSQNRIQQLSNYQGFDYVNFLEWRPDLSMLVSNRDRDLVLYDRQNTLLQFPSQASLPLLNIGWVDDSTLFSFDGSTIRLYNLQGRLVDEQPLPADNLYFDNQGQRWLVHQRQGWYQFAHSQWHTPTLQLLAPLSQQQSHHMQNIRIRGNTLYWQSDWSHHDFIWQLPLDAPQGLALLKSGNLIWHFDVTAHHELTIAQMDSMQGDIKKLSPNPAAH